MIDSAGKFGIEVEEAAADCFELFTEILLSWNQKINLTRITEPNEIIIKHFIDSLLVFKSMEIPESSSLIDIGTGAGFPSFPLKILRRDLKITQIDSVRKKVNFLNEASRFLNFDSITAVHLRAEEGSRKKELRERFDFATARAVARLAALAEYSIPYLKLNGYFIALKGFDIESELEEALDSVSALGGSVEDVKKFILPDSSKRSIVIIKKISHTPTKYPRNASKILKANKI